jgi:hypothetical protein
MIKVAQDSKGTMRLTAFDRAGFDKLKGEGAQFRV